MAENGNVAALREALEELMKFTCNSCNERYCEEDVEEEDGTRYCSPCNAIIKARAALAAPVRNCDVGTADKQVDRFKRFCYANRTPDNECSKECLFYDTSAVCYCQARWAQMSYEKKKEENSNG